MNAANQRRLPYVVLIGLTLSVQACTAATAPTGDIASTAPLTVEASEEPTSDVVVSAPTMAPADPTSACPEPTADTLLYLDEVNGFCLLVPASFTPRAGSGVYDNVQFVGEIGGEDSPKSASASLFVNVIARPGVAVDVTAAEYVDQAAIAGPFVLDAITREEIMVAGGLPAVAIKNQLVGEGFRRVLYVNAHDTLYEIWATPNLGSTDDSIANVELAWTTMLDSLAFFPPTYSGDVLTFDEVCPTASADTYLVVNRLDGYCVLVPNSFEGNSEYSLRWFFGGPELTGLPSWMEPRVSAVIALHGPTDETVEQITDRSNSESITMTEATVSGYPAVFMDRPYQDFVPDRSAYIVVDGYLYSLVVQPVDPVNYPEAVEPAELVWNTFIDSVAFFEPWQ